MTLHTPRFHSLAVRFLLLCLVCALSAWPGVSGAAVQRVKYQAAGSYLVVEVLDDDLLHLEYGRGSGPATDAAIDTSPMVSKKDYAGPTAFKDDGRGVVETADLRLEINRDNLFLTVIDKTKANLPLTTINPLTLDQARKGIEASVTGDVDLYGLGQQFVEPGNANIDWERRVREGGEFGNVMGGFNGGANGNTQLPVLYVVRGASLDNYALFLDNTYKQRWDFTGSSKWKAEVFGGQVRFYLMSGRDLPDLRKDFMELVGHPLVPPKKMFGLWVSEYGYDRWAELDDKLTTLRRNSFPLDGLVLDLQWFGGIQPGSDNTRMGSLTWDTANFPNPAQKLADLRDRQGVGIMLIEEAYVGRALPEHADLQGRGCLAKRCVGCTDPAYIDVNPWWGKGGMFDYSSDACGDYLHDSKRLPLIRDGVIGHWTDLGEPEMYKRESGYAGNASHADIHNIFNFKWLQSIHRGYERSGSEQRPFMMSRSGSAGIQRFGAAMWSGDIASRLSSLAAHAANQMHMSFSGIDYFGSDIGGFQRNLEGDLNDMYTRWYAFGMLFDIPGRPHVENLCNCKETAPDRIGDARSNLENTRLRYELIPYLYSLAHRAHRFAEPVAPPPVFYYQTDPAVRNLGQHKLLGRNLLAAISTRHEERETDVYLPGGAWFDWYSNQRFDSRGGMTARTPLFRDGLFRLPLYARQGAIVPMQHVDALTLNAVGKRSDGSTRDELVLKVFASEEPSEFTLYEDDGRTIAYRGGRVRETRITQQLTGEQAAITVQGAQGSYDAAPEARNNVVRLVANLRGAAARARSVSLDGQALTQHGSLAAFNAADAGWFNDTGNRTIWAKSGRKPVVAAKQFVVALEAGAACESQYRSISVPGEDNGWNPADPARTLSCSAARVWKGQIKICGGSYKFVADGSWTRNWGANGQQDGPNFPPLRGAGLFDVTFDEANPSQPSFTPLDQSPGLCGVSARFVCDNGDTTPGTSVYVAGSIAPLGNWNTDNAVKLNPDGPYPTWTGMIGGLPASTRIEWKCIKRLETGTPPRVLQWEPGGNNVFTTPAAGSAGVQTGTF
jgi:alpha-glucosidase